MKKNTLLYKKKFFIKKITRKKNLYIQNDLESFRYNGIKRWNKNILRQVPKGMETMAREKS
jgi:hypothetical protein